MAISLRVDPVARGAHIPGLAPDFDEIYRSQLARVQALLRRRLQDQTLVDDVTQETFLRAFKSLDRFEPDRPVWPWLRAIANSALIDALRRRAAARADEQETLESAARVPDLDADPHARYDLRERHQSMKDAMAMLPARQRRVLTLTDIEGWDVQHVASIEGTTAESAKSVLKRARAAFRRTYLAIADERGLLAGTPIGAALVRMRSLRARFGRRMALGSARLFNAAAPYLTDVAVAALLGGALAFSSVAGSAASAKPSVSASLLGSVDRSSNLAIAGGNAAINSTTDRASQPPSQAQAGPPPNQHFTFQAGHSHEGRFEDISLKVLARYGVPSDDSVGVTWDCEQSSVSVKFCDTIDSLPNP